MRAKLILTSKQNIKLTVLGVRITALLTLLMGIINLSSAIQPALVTRLAILEQFIPLTVRHGSRLASALAGFALILLGTGLWRRKRTGWIISVGLLGLTFFLHLLKGLDFEEASLSLIILIMLILLRHNFHAESDPPSIRQGLFVLALSLVFTLAYGTIGYFLLDQHFRIHYQWLDALKQTIVMFTSFSSPGLEPTTGFGLYFAGSIYVIGLATFVFALVMLIRPVLVRNPATPDERARAELIVRKYGHTSLARATLFPDKTYFFGPGETVIAYGVKGRGVMVLGDPIGPPEAIPDAIAAFNQYCGRKDWSPAFISTLPDYLDSYKTVGFEEICIGYEGVVDLSQFSMEGSQNKEYRNIVNRFNRLGYKAEVQSPPLDTSLMKVLGDISNAWLTDRKGVEMHFSDGWFDEDYIRNGPVIVIKDSEESVVAFANLVPEFTKNELTIDLMRHYIHVENGTMEFLFISLMKWAKENGYSTFSLGMSAIVGVGEKPEDPRIEQILHTVAKFGTPLVNFKGLHNFKEKFHPKWEPRYLVYPGAASLPLVLATLVRVHTGK